jgi:tagatose-6-phosphate ketose/aldose isomerase
MTSIPVVNSGTPMQEWLRSLAVEPELGPLLTRLSRNAQAAGYEYTLVEICQQPLLWADTAHRVNEVRQQLKGLLEAANWIVVAGSGSSEYAGQCVCQALRKEIGVPVLSAGAGWLLLEGLRGIPPLQPGLLVSLARSGDSPESAGVVELYLKAAPQVHHLVITCNGSGQLATRFRDCAAVTVLVLDERTNDRSLAMTSSFTNMAFAARSLSWLGQPGAAERTAERLAEAGRHLLLGHTARIAAAARAPFRRAVFLGSGCRFGAARESALKMLEMNAGAIPTMAETYLGLRHGPMCLVNHETLVVCFLSSDSLARAYEEDLIAELQRKRLGARKLIVGEDIPQALLEADDLAVEIPGMASLGDDNVAVLDVVVGQLLAFFRCLAEGLRPDMPSDGVINRVVNKFTVHRCSQETD